MLAIHVKYICSKVLRNDLPTLALENTASKVAQNVKLAMENHYACKKKKPKQLFLALSKGVSVTGLCKGKWELCTITFMINCTVNHHPASP